MAEYEVQKFSKIEWGALAEKAHLVTFGEKRSVGLDTHDFAIVIKCNGKMGGYFTCHEMDSETLYIQYGGTTPEFAKSKFVYPGYIKMVSYCREQYKRIWTRVENTNLGMLKMALKAGFLVNGTSFFNGKIYLELFMEV